MKLLKDKIALITGGARGIGKGIALKFAEHGAKVIFTYIKDSSIEKAELLKQEISGLGVETRAYQSDVSDYKSCETLVSNVLKDFGNIDICVNNAGISKDNLLLFINPEEWNDVMQINLASTFNMTRHVVRPMMKAKKGNIINLSSIIGEMGNPGQSSYAASKAGIIGFTKSIAKELAYKNIRCNAIAPGFIETDMTSHLESKKELYKKSIPLGKFGNIEDVANAAVFLASDLSAYITGQTINICGGLHI